MLLVHPFLPTHFFFASISIPTFARDLGFNTAVLLFRDACLKVWVVTDGKATCRFTVYVSLNCLRKIILCYNHYNMHRVHDCRYMHLCYKYDAVQLLMKSDKSL